MPYSPLYVAASFILNSAHADPVHVNTHCISILFHRAFKLYINQFEPVRFLSHFQSKSNINFTLENEGNSIKWCDVRTQLWSFQLCQLLWCMGDCWLLECSLKNKLLNTACRISDGCRSHRQRQIFVFWRRSLLFNSNIKIKLWCFHVSA